MPKIDLATAPTGSGTRYPAPHDEPCKRRAWIRLGDAAGLTQFGVNLVRLAPGVWSSQRHWHSHEDELAYVLEGEVVLVTDAGEETLRAGDCAGFKAGDRNGHCFQNRSSADVVLLVVGSRRRRGLRRVPRHRHEVPRRPLLGQRGLREERRLVFLIP
jgi:uncharacterized cupin superfamily protein